MTARTSARAYVVPVLDVNWVNFHPMDPAYNYIADAPPLEQCAREVEQCVQLMKDVTDGKVAYAVHSGTYCRTAFYEEPFVGFYRDAVEAGAEICLHTHEEIAGQGTRHQDQAHMTGVLRDRMADLKAAGLEATCYRGGHFAYLDYLTAFLEQNGILIDLSCAPGFHGPAWDALWPDAPTSAFHLCYEGPNRAACPGDKRSRVLEIPLAADLLGSQEKNYWFTEACEEEDFHRVWGKVVGRAEAEGRPQFVHGLFHTSSVAFPHFVERYKRFLDHATANGAVYVAPTEAKALYDQITAS